MTMSTQVDSSHRNAPEMTTSPQNANRQGGIYELAGATPAHAVTAGDKGVVNQDDPKRKRDIEHHVHIGDKGVGLEELQQITENDRDHHVYIHTNNLPESGHLPQQRSAHGNTISGAPGASPEKLKAVQSQLTPQAGVYTDFNRLPVSSVLEPHLIYQKVAKAGAKKSQISSNFQHLWAVFIQSLLGGIYLGLGSVLLLSVGAQLFEIRMTDPGLAKLLLGLFGLPWGLTMIVLMGAELFTANASFLPTAYHEGNATLRGWATNWIISYFGNLAGSLLLAIVIKGSDLLEGGRVEEAVQAVAEGKVAIGWGAAFLRGILCNWCVNLALWMAVSAQDVVSKVVVIFLPISAFAAIGFEHCVANMFLIPFGMMMDADVTVGEFLWDNLIPVTLGNIVSGWLVMSIVYSMLYGSLAARLRLSNGVVEPKDK